MNRIVTILVWVEGWGRAFSSSSSSSQLAAWIGLLFTVSILVAFYVTIVGTETWSNLLQALIVDASVNFFGLAVILLRPVEYSFRKGHEEQQGQEETLEQAPDEEEQQLLQHQLSDVYYSNKLDPPAKDLPLQLHVTIFAVCVISSVICDCLTTHQDHPDASFFTNLAFIAADLLEDTLYCAGFMWLAVTYRLIALRVWAMRDEIENIFSSNTRTTSTTDMQTTLSHIRFAYEETFEAAERVSHRTSVLALLLVSLVVIEMASAVKAMFGHEVFILDLVHLATLRLVLVLAALLLQIALAAADVMHASERLSESMASLEGLLRDQISQVTIYGALADGNNSSLGPSSSLLMGQQANDPRHLQSLADLLKILGFRIRQFPVRISVSWFHLTTEWTMGIALLAATILLALVGVQLPGGE